MIELAALLDRIQSRGFSLRVIDGKVRILGAKQPDQEDQVLIEQLRQRREEIKALLADPQLEPQESQGDNFEDPLLPFENWYPVFRQLHMNVVAETKDFDWQWLKTIQPELHAQIKAVEDRIDTMGEVRLSELLAAMREWRSLILRFTETKLAKPFYRDAFCTIINADCRDVMQGLPRGLVVTDPPYNIGYHYDGYKDDLTSEEYHELIRAVCPLPCVLIHYSEDLCAISQTLKEIPKKIVAWVYPSNTARQSRAIGWFGCKPDFQKDGQPYRNPKDKRIAERIARGEQARLYDWWEIDQVKNTSEEKTDHPCQIPTEIMRRILKITDCELLIDPFAGSGTTLVAAKRLGIRSIGIERNPKYCEIAAVRVAREASQGRC